jgi:hypothetical protein
MARAAVSFALRLFFTKQFSSTREPSLNFDARPENSMSVLPSPTKRDPIWPAATITIGLSLTASWVILLAYGLVKLLELAI